MGGRGQNVLCFIGYTISSCREGDGLILYALLWVGRGKAFDYYTGGFKMGDLMVSAMPHENGLAEKCDEGAGLIGEPSISGLIPVDDQVVGHIAFWAEKGRFQAAREGVERQFAYGVGAGTDGCDLQVHVFRRLSPVYLGGVGFGWTKIYA
jgi:hypothetical protein